jgi:basic membrane protein A and related proteins
MKKALLLTAAAAVALIGLPALAKDFKPAVVYDLGTKMDKSFNEGVHNGAEAFAKKSGKTYSEFEPKNEAQIEQGLRNFARKGFSPIIAVGFNQAKALEKIAGEFKDAEFVIIDSVVDLPNVKSVLFKEAEGSYLAGALAAMKTGTGKLGFIGGMDIPLIRKFSCGYKQGAKAVKANAEVFENMVGTTGAAWNDPVKGGELAKSQIERGADIIFTAAGASGLGALQTAADAGKMGIGVDSNQNHLHPGKMLTSMVKRVDHAAENAFTEALEGKFKAGLNVLGLAEDGVGLAFDANNAPLVTPEMKAKIDEMAKGIVSGSIKVHDYMSDNACPL